ncbi:MAG: S8 family serine peptidase [Flavobacteriaceae bacterium]|jgi:subtilisin family serine protease|nr:S8 family serine peptidase [Flavobacteriaceae bacterium]
MRRLFCVLHLFLFALSFSQELVLVKFKDKPSASYYFSAPTEMLTQKALDRRIKYNIPLSDTDVPVQADYVTAVKNLNIPVIAVSKWFNGVFAEISDVQRTELLSLGCVQGIESFVKNLTNFKTTDPEFISSEFKNSSVYTDTQIEQIGLNHLHDLGYTGENVTIAIIDAGFPGVDTVPAFDYIRTNNQIKGGYNFVKGNNNIYSENNHGTRVLSTIGGNIPGQYKGTAIDADFYLFITETNDVEIPQEEVWWIAAAERADSLGVDIINTSLGYTMFDDPRYDYSISDLDGKTSFISRGAQMAAEKGIFVVVAAGNEGNKPWHKISVPADAEDVFSIGAVTGSGYSAAFSSYGPSADGRIKPDVSALGQGALTVNELGIILSGSGTSFSSPIMAGAIACLVQAYPNVLPSVIRQKIRESASLYANPSNQQGYGIPDFNSVLGSLSLDETEASSGGLYAYPNPVKDILHIKMFSERAGIVEIQFFAYSGQQVYSEKAKLVSGENHISISIPYPVQIYPQLIMKLKTPEGKSISRKLQFFPN